MLSRKIPGGMYLSLMLSGDMKHLLYLQFSEEVINLKKHSEPFDDDLMMKELHEIHHQIYEETKHMTSKEIANKINQEVEEFLRKMGYRLAPTGVGKYKLVEIE
ncbi:hypothetical protein FJZ31_19360 [Candidatus Poribacteria bacterium]|nr:hypothetical protein [Candidatus Poribacteria bacterium]